MTDSRLLLSGFQAAMTLTLDRVIRHTVVHYNLYLHTKFHWNQKNIFVDGLTAGKVQGHVTQTTTTILRSFFRDHPGEPVPEENFWTLWCKGRLTEADTLTIHLGATPSGLTSAHLHHPPYFLVRARCPSCRPTDSVKALKATNVFGLGRRR